MEGFSGDTEETTEDIAGRKKSKLKSLKTRLFGKSKRTGADESGKLSQSASDITAGKGLGSDEDLACPQGMIGSRALSHDSIFLAEQVETDAEPVRVLSQENVHSKIKALQMKLQQQKMHLGPPPLVVPVRRPDDLGAQSEDSGPRSPPGVPGGDTSPQGAFSKMISQSAPRPLSPTVKAAPPKSLSPTPSGPFPSSVPSSSPPSSVEAPLDFATPAHFTPCLDSSAARHRMSVKPKNQRASTKKKPTVTQAPSLSDAVKSSERFESVKEEKQRLSDEEEATDSLTSSQGFPSKSAEAAPVTSEAATKPPRPPHQDYVPPGSEPPVAPQVLRVKPQRRADAMSGERPHSSYIESELKEKREGNFEIQLLSHDKRNTVNKPGLADTSSNQLPTSIGSTVAFKSSSFHQQAQVETESTMGIKRPAQGSGSFHFSISTAKNREAERPRSGSFVEVLEQTEARQKTTKETEEREPKGLQLRGSPFAAGRLRPDAAPPKSSVLPWEKRDSLRRAEGEQARSSQEGMEVAQEAKEEDEEEGKAAFGVKLRSTSQSIRMRSDSCSKSQPKTQTSDDQPDTPRRPDATKPAAEKLPVNIFCAASNTKDLRPTDLDPPGLSLPVNHGAPSAESPRVTPAGVQVGPSIKEAERPQEPQAAPAAAAAAPASEVSWMSLAMEKTKSLQQLFTSRFPRDLTGGQTAGRPQAPAASDAAAGTQTQTQTGKPSATQLQDAVRVESRNQTQTAKLPAVGVQQRTSVASPTLSSTSREQQMPRQSSEDQPRINAAQSVSHPAVQTNPWATQASLHPSSQTETTTQGSATQSLAQSYLSSGPQQTAWGKGALQPVSQPKSAASTSGSAVASPAVPPSVPPSVPPVEKGEREASGQKEGLSLSTRRTVWTGSVTERAAFLERRAEWKTLPGPNGVELKKAPLEGQTSIESPPPAAKITHPSKDTTQEGREGLKPAESSPAKVSEKFREDRWLRKNVAQTSSSAPTVPSVLQSMSDSGQPSWMELAKRKSMAWSDKTMD